MNDIDTTSQAFIDYYLRNYIVSDSFVYYSQDPLL